MIVEGFNGSSVETVSYLVTDFGSALVPPSIAATIDRVPCRKNGRPDRRYRSARKLMAWWQRMNDLAGQRYVAGDADPVRVEPFEP